MKLRCCIFCLLSSCYSFAQIPITGVTVIAGVAAFSTTYTDGVNTYNWGVSPNNTTALLSGFTAGGLNYGFTNALTGTIKLRRVNNPVTTGNFTLTWAESTTSTNVFNMFTAYENDMEAFFNNHIYNKGADNFFDNTSANSNNIERLDWILPGAGFHTPAPDKIGFAIFDRGATGGHDPFCIAVITSLDGLGNPASYGNIVRVVGSNFGDPPGSGLTYSISKGNPGSGLLDAGTGTQNRGGVFISLQNLGVASGAVVYGYSMTANDLPVAAVPGNLVDYTNPVYFPVNTLTGPGGIDLIAVTGIYTDLTILPVRFASFAAVEKNDIIWLRWTVENELSVDKYVVERGTDGSHFLPLTELKAAGGTDGDRSYAVDDNDGFRFAGQLYYRIRQIDHSGSFYYSKVISVSRQNKIAEIVIYPNPVTGNLILNIASRENDKVTIIITNAAGLHLSSQPLRLFPGNNSCSVSGVENLPAGVYQLLVAYPSGKTSMHKFVKK